MTTPGLPTGPFRASVFHGRDVPPRVWNVPDLIPGATVTLLTGDGGTGKSTLALQLAIATATDSPWLGLNPKTGAALYLSAEDDGDELQRRCNDITRGLGVGLNSLDNLHLWPVADADALLATEGDGQIAPTAFWSAVEAAAREIQPVLIILDPLADLFGGNENHRGQVRQFVGLLRRLAQSTGAAVLVISHPSLSGLNSGSGTSGSTAWSNSVRSRMYFSRPPGDDLEADSDARILSLKKSNYAPAQADMRLRRLPGGFQIDAGAPQFPASRAAFQAEVDDLFMVLLDSFTASGRTVTDQNAINLAPTVFAKDPRANGVTKKGFADAMARLFAAGKIRIEESGPASRRRRQIVRAGLNTS